MNRPFNFSAGPAVLPDEVLRQAQEELLNWKGSGVSIMEIGHRTKEFNSVINETEADLRKLLNIPVHYKVLFLSGGATGQFAAVPMNLLRGKEDMDYLITGTWSEKAMKQASLYGKVNIVAHAEESRFSKIPEFKTWQRNPNAAFLHYTPNETIHGLELFEVPDTEGVPLVADMTSNILSRPIDVTRFGLIYAGVQKNMGAAGLAVVIVREDLLGQPAPFTPFILDYTLEAKERSVYNTPPTFIWYMVQLMLKWVIKEGGVSVMAERNQRKSQKLYQAIDASNFYNTPVLPPYRSWMNVPITMANQSLEAKFLEQAEEAGLLGLKGHRLVGGIRASLYNAMPEKGVDALIEFMKEFERKNG